jgi:hypothetical protein
MWKPFFFSGDLPVKIESGESNNEVIALDLFTRFVQENIDQTETSKEEILLVLPKELVRAFEHYCRKRNLRFSDAIVQLMEEALANEKKPTRRDPEEKEGPDARLFMKDALD